MPENAEIAELRLVCYTGDAMATPDLKVGRRGTRPRSRREHQLRWLGRCLFAAGAAWLIIAWWPWRQRAPHPASTEPTWRPAWERVDWTRVGWEEWTNRQYGLSLERPDIWPADNLFESMTESPLGDLRKAPIAGFRGETPVVIYRYLASAPESWAAWTKRLDAQQSFRQEFGARIRERRLITLSSQPALELTAEGATRGRLWIYRSLLFARGNVGFRITAGADGRDWARMAPVFQRILASVRCSREAGRSAGWFDREGRRAL
jgi:hypothetical protein